MDQPPDTGAPPGGGPRTSPCRRARDGTPLPRDGSATPPLASAGASGTNSDCHMESSKRQCVTPSRSRQVRISSASPGPERGSVSPAVSNAAGATTGRSWQAALMQAERSLSSLRGSSEEPYFAMSGSPAAAIDVATTRVANTRSCSGQAPPNSAAARSRDQRANRAAAGGRDSQQLSAGPSMLAKSTKCPVELLQRPYWSLRDFNVMGVIRSSKSCAIYLATVAHSGRLVVLKAFAKRALSASGVASVDGQVLGKQRSEAAVRREIDIHARLDHPSVISLYGAFQDNDHIIMVMEYAAGGDLFKCVRKNDVPEVEEAMLSRIVLPTLSGLTYLHSQKVCHRDIKLENILLTEDGQPKIGGFSAAVDATRDSVEGCAGTFQCMSPEVLCRQVHGWLSIRESDAAQDTWSSAYDEKADIWSLGCMLYELFCKATPFEGSSHSGIIFAIVCKDPTIPPHLSEASAALLRKCLAKDPLERPSSSDLLTLIKHSSRSTVLADGSAGQVEGGPDNTV